MKAFAFLLLVASTVHAQAPELITAGDALDQQNRNSEALSLYVKADAIKPNDSEILRRISKQYAQLMLDATTSSERAELGRKALDAAKRAVAADPDNAQAHLSLAIVYGRIALNEPPRRKIEMSRLIKLEAETAARLDPKNDYAWHVLGRWNYEIANFNPLLKALAQRSTGKSPMHRMRRPLNVFRGRSYFNPRRVIHHLELGRTYLALGEKQKARDELNKELSLPSIDKDDDENMQRARVTLKRLK